MLDAPQAYFGSGSSSLVVVDTLLFATTRKGLAGNPCYVRVDSGVFGNAGVGPGIFTQLNGIEVGPNEVSRVAAVLGCAPGKSVTMVQASPGLGAWGWLIVGGDDWERCHAVRCVMWRRCLSGTLAC